MRFRADLEWIRKPQTHLREVVPAKRARKQRGGGVGPAGQAEGHPVGADAVPEATKSPVLVAAMPATASHNRLALLTSVVFVTACILSVPFARSSLAQFPAVVALLQAVQVTADLIIAALLFAQFSVHRSRALNLLAAGYL